MIKETFVSGRRKYGLVHVTSHGYGGESVSLEELQARASKAGPCVGSELARRLLRGGIPRHLHGLKLVFPGESNRYGFPLPVTRVPVLEGKPKPKRKSVAWKLLGHPIVHCFGPEHYFVVPLR